MEFSYYYGAEAEQFSFIRIPKRMLTEESFSSLSLAAKILYGVLLDRMALSVKNGWLDDEKRVYIIFKIEEIQDLFGFSKKKAIEYLGELENFGLVEKKRRGLGLPSILYIKSFMGSAEENGTSRGVEIDTSVSEEKTDIVCADNEENNENNEESSKNQEHEYVKCAENKPIVIKLQPGTKSSCVRSVDLGTSGGVKNALQEVPLLTPLKNNTNINKTYLSNTESNLIESGDSDGELDEMESYSQLIKTNIEYDYLLQQYPYEKELVEGIFELILEMVLRKGEQIVISSGTYPVELVRSKFLKINYGHVEYVISCLQRNTTKVKNIKKYLLAALFNAPSTISGYYTAEVNHDMPQFARAK